MQVPEVYPPGAPRVISGYGSLIGVRGGHRASPHDGLDIERKLGKPYAGRGEPVLAAADGKVIIAGFRTVGGNRIIVYHGKDIEGRHLYTGYAHMDELLVETGQTVKRGQKIGTVGDTGSGSFGVPHLHLNLFHSPTDRYQISKLTIGERVSFPDGQTIVDPHEYWYDGYYRITCFDPKRNYSTSPIRFTYPVECKR